MIVPSKNILKPGAVLTVRIIDFSDPDVIDFVKRARAAQKAILKHKIVSNETLKQVITI